MTDSDRSDDSAVANHSRWVFGYGSLMWSPGFEVLSSRPATLVGYHRALCLSSALRWGTPAAPGLVVGLIKGGRCDGRLLEVAANAWADVRAYLEVREGPAYARVQIAVEVGDAVIEALAFVARPEHPVFVGKLTPMEAANRILQAAPGQAGTAYEYVRSTAEGLRDQGHPDPGLEAVLSEIARLTAESGGSSPSHR